MSLQINKNGKKGNSIYFPGFLVGLGTFCIIGILHAVVIKGEYYFGKECWPVFVVFELISCIASLFINHMVISILLIVLGFSLFWGISELFKQEERVSKGWYPANPKRRHKYTFINS